MRNKKARRRLVSITAVYLASVFILWLIYQNTVFTYVRTNTTETAGLVAGQLVDRINGEFSRMRLVTSTLAGSAYVHDFYRR